MFVSTLPILGTIAAVSPLDGRPRYIHEGWFLISVANLTVILLMIAVFCLALLLPFPRAEVVEGTEDAQ